MLSKSITETSKIAKVFLEKILKSEKNKGSAVMVGLSGELGAGKTTFTKQVAKHLKIKNKVISPTFIIMKKYSLKLKGYKYFFHFDAYRLENEKELLHLGWEEILKDQRHIIFIEWPENVKKAIPKYAQTIKISNNEKGHRKLELK